MVVVLQKTISNDKLKRMIIGDVAPILIPVPFCGEYKSDIGIYETHFCRFTIFNKKDFALIYPASLPMDDIKTFMLENIFKTQESIIIYNLISSETLLDFRIYSIKIIVKNGNQTMVYTFNTMNLKSFTDYLKQYSLLAHKNNLSGMGDTLNNTVDCFDTEKEYKFKSKRKSLL